MSHQKDVVVFLVILTIAISFIFYYENYKIKTTNPRDYVNKSCISDEECTFVSLECCNPCGLGEPVNIKSAEIISRINDMRCDRSKCLRVSCGSITKYILKPKSVCKNNQCTLDWELDCRQYCYLKKLDEAGKYNATNAFINTAKILNITIEELKKRCTCD